MDPSFCVHTVTQSAKSVHDERWARSRFIAQTRYHASHQAVGTRRPSLFHIIGWQERVDRFCSQVRDYISHLPPCNALKRFIRSNCFADNYLKSSVQHLTLYKYMSETRVKYYR